MRWISSYQLFLFDFDGLLVNTESLHHQAYQIMCAKRGYTLEWDFYRYSQAAHHHATGLKEQIYATFPSLKLQEPDWSVLYAEKKQAFISLIKQKQVHLMPGVENLLNALKEAQVKQVVVTHSSCLLTDLIRSQIPLLNTLPHWLTREDYFLPKPYSDCYQLAIDRFALPNDQIIGFEDSPRGLKALTGTRALPVLICDPNYPYVESLVNSQVIHYANFTDLINKNSSHLKIEAPYLSIK